MAAIPSSTATAKFSHRFSGISVWLEPDPSQTCSLLKEMDFLIQKCGGHEAGMHRIVPHCTLLYNTSFPCSTSRLMGQDDTRDTADYSEGIHSSDDNNSDYLSKKGLQRRQGEDLLRHCLTEYRHLHQQTNELDALKMIPTSHYYFPYPKTADGGRGFGCAISLLILETTPDLKSLQEVVKKVFPPDERHGGAGSEKEHEMQEEVKFQPHMALVYAPEEQENVTNGWLEEHTLKMEQEKRYLDWTPTTNVSDGSKNQTITMEEDTENQSNHNVSEAWDAKYLSIWSTEGTLDEWFPIAKLDLLQDD